MVQSEIQLGKQGITENFITTLKNHFNKHTNVKIHVLKNARSDKESLKKYEKDILKKLGEKYTSKILGFSIFIKRWRRSVR